MKTMIEHSHTRVTYLYRDASNYKYWGTFVLAGKFETEEVRKWMFDGECFVPERIGIPSLVPEARSEDDHDLHSLEECEGCSEAEAMCTVGEFIERMKKANEQGWFTDYGSWFFGKRVYK